MRLQLFLKNLILILVLLIPRVNAQHKTDSKLISNEVYTFSNVSEGKIIEVSVPEEMRDLSSFNGVSTLISNQGNTPFRIEGYLNNERWINSVVYLGPGEVEHLVIIFKRTKIRGTEEFPAMNGLPGGTIWHWKAIDPSFTEKVTFNLYSKDSASFTISNISAYGQYSTPAENASKSGFYPFIDQYGQYKYDEWPRKVHSDEELHSAALIEVATLQNQQGPADRNVYGGWLSGPQREATGHFRVENINDKWWIIDPEGRLFWSHGLTCVGYRSATTRISEREHFFEGLPDESSPLAIYYGSFGDQKTFNYTSANLQRKYGVGWHEKALAISMKRLKSWGLTSFGNWSDPEIYLKGEPRVPYTVAVSPKWPKIDGDNVKFPDVFDPRFRQSIEAAMATQGEKTKNDPFCIGYFVDNELHVDMLTQALMKQPANTAAKKAWISWEKERYGNVKSLNKAWGTEFSSWNQVAALNEAPTEASVKELAQFDSVIFSLYSKTCLEAVKKVASDKMYLGSRLHCHYYPDDRSEEGLIRIAARYCDIVSFNRYRFSAADLILPEGLDKPVIIGEFHFGALDRGHLHTGLRSVGNQQQRAEAYYGFVKGALENRQIVGTHWFQYGDQAFTGRGDGENYQIGFVDICDNPYPEIIAESRKIGYVMYKIRLKNDK